MPHHPCTWCLLGQFVLGLTYLPVWAHDPLKILHWPSLSLSTHWSSSNSSHLYSALHFTHVHTAHSLKYAVENTNFLLFMSHSMSSKHLHGSGFSWSFIVAFSICSACTFNVRSLAGKNRISSMTVIKMAILMLDTFP